ncbi:RecQ family ATP-dependent DNA helicase [Nocardioides yefusunii]|uniref:DNA 3'-5' helicase n=1 Tax=Nocardioides yefusunii TaxID=2500546 RepID=A0ABW1R3Q4_9ACTN|nr:DEAD/DEAH box helicase [Nocardioides yefusunii]
METSAQAFGTATPEQRAAARAAAEGHLRALVGRDDARLREDQWSAIEALAVDSRRALVVQRTGWGKSAVYFVATLLLRSRGAGPTVIVSPLLALMRNQIASAERAGIRAVTINSTNADQWEPIHAAINNGEVDVLLVSPERLNNPGFRDEVLPRLAATCGLLVVDEAHCISDWGHDFRPDYRRIRTLLDELPAGIPVLATTATANERVTGDVAEQLSGSRHLDASAPNSVLVLRGTLDRESLRLGVMKLRSVEQRLAWLADFVASQPGSGIIYCLTVAATQEVSSYLRERGLDVRPYSGQTEAEDRSRLEGALVAGELKGLVATSALGMGFDATLSYVVNLGAPSSPVAYYQQVGRAGRGTDDATVVLLPQPEDRDIWAYFASLAFPPEQVVRQTLEVLATQGTMSTAGLETYVDLSRNRLETMLKVLDVDGAVKRVKGGWEATGQPWSYDAERYARVTESRQREQAAMLGYLDSPVCRMRYLREQLDDAGAVDCGRCDNCGGLLLSTQVNEQFVQAAQERLSRPGVAVEPRKMWPTALANMGIELKGKISGQAEEGRAVARMTDLGHGQQVRELFRDTTPDGPVPLPLVQAMIQVIQDWRPQVDCIVVVESTRRGLLTADLANGLSRYLRIPVVGAFALVDPDVVPGAGATNSAQRVAAVRRRARLILDDGDLEGRRVLLVDDQVNTGWTLTLAAQQIREAGAEAVMPLVLAVQA